MPLINGKSKKSFSKNVAIEMEAGKPQKQALAIAYNVKRKATRKKMADGGMAMKKESYPEVEKSKKTLEESKMISKPTPAPKLEDSVKSLKDQQMMARGGKVGQGHMVSKDQEPVHFKKNSKLGDEYEGDNKPNIHAGAKDNYSSPAMRDFMSNRMNMVDKDTPQDSDEHTRPMSEYEGKEASDPLHGEIKARYHHMKMMAKGGSVYGGKSEYDGVEHPHGLEEDDDQMRPSSNDYMSDEWAGGPDMDHTGKYPHPSEHEYMSSRMPAYSKGGHVEDEHSQSPEHFIDEEESEAEREEHILSLADKIRHKRKMMASGGEVTDHEEEGPGTDQSFNIKAKKYNQEGSDSTIEHDPWESNEHGDEHEMEEENEHDMIDSIRKKLKAKRGF